MDQAHSLVPGTTETISRLTAQKLAIAEALCEANKFRVATKLSRGDRKRRRYWLKTMRRWMAYDREFQGMYAAALKGELMMGLGPAVQGLIRRAARGQPMAVKLLFESSGFHNPRMTHDHTGEVVIKLDMPRPVATTDEPIPDADVVEE